MGAGTPTVFFRELGGVYPPPNEGTEGSNGPTGPLYDWFCGLSFDDSCCWAFGLVEGDLEELYWNLSYWELSQKIRLKYQELASIQLCHFVGLAEIISQALGGGSKSSPKKPKYDLLPSTGDLEADVAAINALLRGG